jgi:ATP-dependent DNA helicase RecG
MKTVAAFANGEGGAILFGVSDEGEILGLDRTVAHQNARDRLSNIVRSWVSPAVRFRIDRTEAGGDRTVLIFRVEPGQEPPYGVGIRPTDIRFYVRRGATSFPAIAAELRALARSRPSDVRYPSFR